MGAIFSISLSGCHGPGQDPGGLRNSLLNDWLHQMAPSLFQLPSLHPWHILWSVHINKLRPIEVAQEGLKL